MKKVLIIAFVLAFSGTAYAQTYKNPYSYNTNNYTKTGSGYRGSNYSTGSSWNANSYGSTTRGTDKNGNSWSYNRSTGSYYNYGTGERRVNGKKLGY